MSSYPIYQADRNDYFILYRPSGSPVSTLRFNVDSVFSLLTVTDITGLDTLGIWNGDGTNVWWDDGNVGVGIAAPLTQMHLGQADGAAPSYGTKTRGLQFGQTPLGYINLFQNSSNELQFTVDDVNQFKVSSTGIDMQSDILPVTTALYDLGAPALNFDTLYVRDIYIDDSLMADYITARLPGVAAAGNENEIQYNDGGVLGASSNFKFNDTTLVVKDGNNNVFIGDGVADSRTSASNSVSVGFESGNSFITGQNNVFIGKWAGRDNNLTDNVFIGYRSGIQNISAQNVFIGMDAGLSNITGLGNVFIGSESGYNETGSNKLYIENSNSATPLIYGEFDNDLIQINGDLKAQDDTLEVTADTTFIRNKLKVTDGVIYLNGRVITPARASAYIAEGDESTTTISAADTYYFLQGTFTNVDTCDFRFTGDTLQYIGEEDVDMTLHYSCTFTVGQVSTGVTTAVSINDVVLGQSVNDRLISSTSDIGSWSGVATVELETNDKIKIIVKANKTGDVTAERFSAVLE